MRTKERYDDLVDDEPVTCEDIAHIANVQTKTVWAWAQRDGSDFPGSFTRDGYSPRILWFKWGKVREWLCRTGRIDCPGEMWDREKVREIIGVAAITLKVWRSQGKVGFPEPDAKIGREPVWKPSTIRRWMEEHPEHVSPRAIDPAQGEA